MKRRWFALGFSALSLATACGSDHDVSRPSYLPLATAPAMRIEEGDPPTTIRNGQPVAVIREVCASDETPCAALSLSGATYVRGGWLLNEQAIQALGDELGVAADGGAARALFDLDTVVGYRPSPDAAWEALIASWATDEAANRWLLCSALASPDPGWITCDGYDLDAAGLNGQWMATAAEVLEADCPELGDVLRGLGDRAVGAGSSDEPLAYAVAALVDARWLDLGCTGHLTLPA